MQHAQQIDAIRRLIHATLSELRVEHTELRETILIRDGHYCGRRFHAAKSEAIWFIEEDQVKFYGEDGRVMKTVNVRDDHGTMPEHAAA